MPNKNRMFYGPTSAPSFRVRDGRESVDIQAIFLSFFAKYAIGNEKHKFFQVVSGKYMTSKFT